MDNVGQYYLAEENLWGAWEGRGRFTCFTFFANFPGSLPGLVLWALPCCVFVLVGFCFRGNLFSIFTHSSCWPTMSRTSTAMQEKKKRKGKTYALLLENVILREIHGKIRDDPTLIWNGWLPLKQSFRLPSISHGFWLLDILAISVRWNLPIEPGSYLWWTGRCCLCPLAGRRWCCWLGTLSLTINRVSATKDSKKAGWLMIFYFGRDFQEAATWDSTDELIDTDNAATKMVWLDTKRVLWWLWCFLRFVEIAGCCCLDNLQCWLTDAVAAAGNLFNTTGRTKPRFVKDVTGKRAKTCGSLSSFQCCDEFAWW